MAYSFIASIISFFQMHNTGIRAAGLSHKDVPLNKIIIHDPENTVNLYICFIAVISVNDHSIRNAHITGIIILRILIYHKLIYRTLDCSIIRINISRHSRISSCICFCICTSPYHFFSHSLQIKAVTVTVHCS